MNQLLHHLHELIKHEHQHDPDPPDPEDCERDDCPCQSDDWAEVEAAIEEGWAPESE